MLEQGSAFHRVDTDGATWRSIRSRICELADSWWQAECRDRAELFPTTVVGSMPRPAFLKELFDDYHEGKSATTSDAASSTRPCPTPSRCKKRRASTSSAMASGGGSRTSVSSPTSPADFRAVSRGRRATASTGTWSPAKCVPCDPGLLADDARFARQHTARPLKVALPSPYLLSVRMWDAERSRSAYPTREAFADARRAHPPERAHRAARRRRAHRPARRSAPLPLRRPRRARDVRRCRPRGHALRRAHQPRRRRASTASPPRSTFAAATRGARVGSERDRTTPSWVRYASSRSTSS